MIFDALIIGGGPAGATTALLLAKAGWSVAIVEKKMFPRKKVCGEFISATSFPLLQKLGIDDMYYTHAGPDVSRVGLFAAETVLSSAMPPANNSFKHWGRALGREHFDTALLDMSVRAGATLWQPWIFKSIQRHDAMFTATITSHNTMNQISARVVIMANGSWERGYEELNSKPHKSSDMLAFKAHFRDTELAPELMPLLAFPGGYGGLVHSDDGRVTLSCCIRRDMLQKVRQQYVGSQAGDAVFDHISSSCLGVRQVLSRAKREGNWLAVGPIRPGIRKRYADGMFFVGNIAGEAHPVVAEGISMAMQSAWLLSQLLIERQSEINSSLDTTGQSYTKQWDHSFSHRIYAASLFAQIAMRPRMVASLLPLLRWFPGILTLGATLSGKVKQVVPTITST